MVSTKEVFSQIPSYADCTDMIKECDYQQACTYYDSASYEEALSIFESISGYKDTLEKIPNCKYEIACKYLSEENYEGAIALFKNLGDYSDSQQKVTECTYLEAKRLIDVGEYNKATAQLSTISNYKDSAKYIKLMDDAVSMVFSNKVLTYETSYMWIISKIDTQNCKSELLVFTGQALGKDDSLDSATAKPDYAIKRWKEVGGKLYMTQGGEDPNSENGPYIYDVWTISGNWEKITSWRYRRNGTLTDSQSTIWTRVTGDLEVKINSSFVSCFATHKYTQWEPEEYAYLQALLKQ